MFVALLESEMSNHLKSSVVDEGKSALPDAEESHVRLASDCAVSEDVRNRLMNRLGGRFARMYELSRNTHRYFGLMGDNSFAPEGIPAFPDAFKTEASFSEEDFELASRYQNPSLLMRPPKVTHVDLISRIRRKHKPGARGELIISAPEFGDNDPIDSYRAYIAEGACDMDVDVACGDSLILPQTERIRIFFDTRESGERGMSAALYSLLSMQSILRQGNMIDQRFYTILDDEPTLSDKHVAIGTCMDGVPRIEWMPQKSLDNSRGRFRRVLGGRSIET